jgi:hypothetical protein
MFLSRVLVAISFAFAFGSACSDDDSTPPPDATPGAAIGYLQPCDIANDLCDTSLNLACFPFNMKGPHCTHSCGGDGECEAPSPGCSGMDVCKIP